VPYQEEEPQQPCDCPDGHHFCLGTHIFAICVERCELPIGQPETLDEMLPLLCFDEIASEVVSLVDAAESQSEQTADAQRARAVLQVYLL